MNTTASTSSAVATGSSRSAARQWLRALGPFLGLAVVIVFFATISGNPGRYLSANNLRIVLTQTVIVALSAIGMTVIIISGGIDLSLLFKSLPGAQSGHGRMPAGTFEFTY